GAQLEPGQDRPARSHRGRLRPRAGGDRRAGPRRPGGRPAPVPARGGARARAAAAPARGGSRGRRRREPRGADLLRGVARGAPPLRPGDGGAAAAPAVRGDRPGDPVRRGRERPRGTGGARRHRAADRAGGPVPPLRPRRDPRQGLRPGAPPAGDRRARDRRDPRPPRRPGRPRPGRRGAPARPGVPERLRWHRPGSAGRPRQRGGAPRGRGAERLHPTRAPDQPPVRRGAVGGGDHPRRRARLPGPHRLAPPPPGDVGPRPACRRAGTTPPGGRAPPTAGAPATRCRSTPGTSHACPVPNHPYCELPQSFTTPPVAVTVIGAFASPVFFALVLLVQVVLGAGVGATVFPHVFTLLLVAVTVMGAPPESPPLLALTFALQVGSAPPDVPLPPDPPGPAAAETWLDGPVEWLLPQPATKSGTRSDRHTARLRHQVR